MAVESIGYRKEAIAISAGLGLALPLVAYVATFPFDGAGEAVRSDMLPLAVGSLAGVGMLALSGRLLDARAERIAEERAEADRLKSAFFNARGADTTHVSQPSVRARGHRTKSETPAGVPVISRAIDALDEAEAWAEIDAMFNSDSPISCDPTRSKDMYQIALEELRRAEQAPADASAQSAAQSVSRPVSYPVPQATSQPAARPISHMASQYASSPAGQVVSQPGSHVVQDQVSAEAREDVLGRDEAMASLYGSSVARNPYVPVLPKMQPAPAPAPFNRGYSMVASGPQAAASDEGMTVPMADYSGHEGMWARALAILAEEPSPSDTNGDETMCVDKGRMAALAEGGNSTNRHVQVNALIEDEFDKVESKSVHSVAHEYLKVIEGGTASMDARQLAEA